MPIEKTDRTWLLLRLEIEKGELTTNIKKLSTFLVSEKAKKLSKKQITLMKKQLVVMKKYLSILDERVNLIKGDETMNG